MLVYQYNTDEHGWVTFPDIESVLESIRVDLESASAFPDMIEDAGDEFNLKVCIMLMSEDEYDALPEVD